MLIKAAGLFLLAGFLFSFALALIRPINDPDTFWHLATGKWIIEHRTLPSEDPFAFTTQKYAYETYERTRFLLRQYWVGQLIIYLSYLIGGYWGVIVLRLIIFLSIAGLLFLWMNREGVGLSDTILFLVPAGFILIFYVGDRPNQMTYLFSVAALFFIQMVREGRKSGWLIIPLMLLWANIHGGYILGDILLGAGLIEALFIVRDEGSRKKAVLFSTAILFSFLNPNHVRIIFNLLEREPGYLSKVTENLPPFSFLKWGVWVYLVIIGVTFILLVPSHVSAFSRNGKRRSFFYLIVSALLLGLSLMGIRYIPLFVLLMLPFIAGELKKSVIKHIPLQARLVVSVVAISLFIGLSSFPYLKSPQSFRIITNKFPERTVRFMKDRKIKGDIFNTHNIGGYLIWSLYPDCRVFIDGRALVSKVFYIYSAVASGREEPIGGVPLWKATLDSYGIRYAVVSPLDTIGQMMNITIRLYDDPDWHLNHIDPLSGVMLFSKDRTLPELPGILAYSNILKRALAYKRMMPDSPQIYVTLAKVNTLLGRRSEAIRLLEEGIRKHPSWREGYIGQLLDYVKKNEMIRW